MASTKFLLSTGYSTTDEAEYVLDLLKVYMYTNPGDIPHTDELGYDFTIVGVTKNNLRRVLQNRLEDFIRKLSKSFPDLTISLESLELISEEQAKVVISINGISSSDYFINIYENS